MAELVDALDSKSSFRKEVWVRFPLEVQKPSKSFDLLGFVFMGFCFYFKIKFKL